MVTEKDPYRIHETGTTGMLPTRLKIFLTAAIIVFFIIVLYLLKKRRISLKYTLLWLLTGVVMLIFVIFPQLMSMIAALLGIQTTMNTLYLLLLAFVLVLLMMLTSIVSKQTERIGHLAQSNAMLEKRVRELEGQLQPETDQSDRAPGESRSERSSVEGGLSEDRGSGVRAEKEAGHHADPDSE